MRHFSRGFKTFAVLVAFGFCGLACAEEETLVSRLPGKYAHFAWGGAGRYVAFHLEAEKKVLVYDLAEKSPRLAFEIPNVPAGDLLAACAEKLVLVSPGKMMIRRWDLKSRKRDKLAVIAGNDPPQKALLGFAGSGPLLIVGRQQSQFFDLETLKPLSIEGSMIPGMHAYGLSVHVSPDGRTFGTIPVGYGPVGYAVWHLKGNRLSPVSFGGTSHAIRGRSLPAMAIC